VTSAWAFLKRDFLLATSYKLDFAVQLLRIAALVPMYFYFSRMVSGSQSLEFERYGGSYFAFLLTGMAFLDYLGVSLQTFNQSLRDSQLMGTLEIMLLSPTSLTGILLYSSLWVYLFATIRFLLYLSLGLMFDLELGRSDVLAALVILLLAVVGFAGLGILSASITVVAKRGLGVNWVVSLASLICGGVLFPTTVLPGWLQKVSAYIPITHALEGMRLALLKGYSLSQLGPQVAILLIFAGVLVPGGLIAFAAAIRRTKVTGTLGQY